MTRPFAQTEGPRITVPHTGPSDRPPADAVRGAAHFGLGQGLHTVRLAKCYKRTGDGEGQGGCSGRSCLVFVFTRNSYHIA